MLFVVKYYVISRIVKLKLTDWLFKVCQTVKGYILFTEVKEFHSLFIII